LQPFEVSFSDISQINSFKPRKLRFYEIEVIKMEKVISECAGGLINQIYSSTSKIEVEIVDWDDLSQEEADIKEAQLKQIKSKMVQIY